MDTARSIPSPRTSLLRLRRNIALATAACAMVTIFWSATPAWAVGQKHTLTTDKGETLTLTHPGEWTALRQANVTTLIRAREDAFRRMNPEGRAEIPQMTVSTDERDDHADAVRRLAEIAAERDVAPTWLEIGGWPALQRRFLTQRPQAGEESSHTEMVMQITTAVAVGDELLRMET